MVLKSIECETIVEIPEKEDVVLEGNIGPPSAAPAPETSAASAAKTPAPEPSTGDAMSTAGCTIAKVLSRTASSPCWYMTLAVRHVSRGTGPGRTLVGCAGRLRMSLGLAGLAPTANIRLCSIG